jgi:dual specificity tyrosine-phosphorylation-regulated kinase 2/3/4
MSDSEALSDRPVSASDALDPYYFIHDPSPVPPLPSADPHTPARDPGSIDRRGLVGVGELATPRWPRDDPHQVDRDENDSPWTIEAIDGEEVSEKEEVGFHVASPDPDAHLPSLQLSDHPVHTPARRLRTQRSTDESGGEEILYPRNVPAPLPLLDPPPVREKDKEKDKASASPRKHRSLTANRRSSTNPLQQQKSLHARHASAGGSPSRPIVPPASDFSHLPPSPSSSSIQQFLRSTGIGARTTTPQEKEKEKEKDPRHNAPLTSPTAHVAHSLLRGTQEGWSGLDDEATAEALRKLDGLSTKSARARMSVASLSGLRSRPNTPPKPAAGQWEGVSSDDAQPSSVSGLTRKGSRSSKDRHVYHQAAAVTDGLAESPLPDKSVKRSTSSSQRSSLNNPKRSSASSTTSASIPSLSPMGVGSSAGTSTTSISIRPGSSGKSARRNSASSDISVHSSSDAATALKDRVASLALSLPTADGSTMDELDVPPVPPLPKDLSGYKSPPSTASSAAFVMSPDSGKDKNDGYFDALSVSSTSSNKSAVPLTPSSVHVPYEQPPSSAHSSLQPTSPKTPSKKWSFSALNSLISSSPSSHSTSKHHSTSSSAAKSAPSTREIRKSLSRDHLSSASAISSTSSVSSSATKSASSSTLFDEYYSAQQPDAMRSAASLGSLGERGRSGHRTADSGPESTAHSTAPITIPRSQPVDGSAPLSPGGSLRKHSSKRLTPSSIPAYFRRSSSHSIHVPSTKSSAGAVAPPSPTFSTTTMTTSNDNGVRGASPTHNPPSSSAPHRKSSVLSLGGLLKSSSRKSLIGESREAALRDAASASEKVSSSSSSSSKRSSMGPNKLQKAEAEREKERKKEEKEREKEKKKEEKDRSESRISVLMGRKRGKVSVRPCPFYSCVVLTMLSFRRPSRQHLPQRNQSRRSISLPFKCRLLSPLLLKGLLASRVQGAVRLHQIPGPSRHPHLILSLPLLILLILPSHVRHHRPRD